MWRYVIATFFDSWYHLKLPCSVYFVSNILQTPWLVIGNLVTYLVTLHSASIRFELLKMLEPKYLQPLKSSNVFNQILEKTNDWNSHHVTGMNTAAVMSRFKLTVRNCGENGKKNVSSF